MRVTSPHREEDPGTEAPLYQVMDKQALSWPSGTRLSAAIKTHSADIKGSTAVHIWLTSAPPGRDNNICILMTGPKLVRQAPELTKKPPELTEKLEMILILDSGALALSRNVRPL